MKNITDYTLEELNEAIFSIGEKNYRSTQIFEWVWKRGVSSFDDMTNLPVDLRKKLSATYHLNSMSIETVKKSSDGTKKYLFRLRDNKFIESVFIPAKKRKTVCISTSVGCKFGCRFCASGLNGFYRNLTAGEIAEQVLHLRKEEGNITNVVYMGMGEPLDNYKNLIRSIKILNDKKGINIGIRKITVSTSGIIPGIEKLSNESLQLELSVSLHAGTDKTRSVLMPVNKIYPFDNLIQACKRYYTKTNRLITFEYTLIKNINDGMKEAESLANILDKNYAKLNLITFNKVTGLKYEAPAPAKVNTFYEFLVRKNINVTMRRKRGDDISAACGQLVLLK